MKTQAFLLLSALLFSMSICQAQDTPPEKLVGTWQKHMGQRPLTFSISSDQKFEVEFAGNSETDVWGSYKVKGAQITFTDEGGDYSSGSSCIYEFKVDDSSLSFIKVDDPVPGRSTLLEGTWTRSAGGE